MMRLLLPFLLFLIISFILQMVNLVKPAHQVVLESLQTVILLVAGGSIW